VSTRSAVVVVGIAPDVIPKRDNIDVRANKLGVLITGKPGDLVVDLAYELEGPVYDVMWNAQTSWFAVTIYRGGGGDAVRWDNKPGTDCGYPRVEDVLGATTPQAILTALDIPADAIGYVTT
jgi:hypothetical protein